MKYTWGIDGITEAEPLYVLYKGQEVVLQFPVPKGKHFLNMDDSAKLLSKLCTKLNS